MTEHKVKAQSAFTPGRTAFSLQVTLTCSCGENFTSAFQGKRSDGKQYLERKALEKAEQVFRAHIPIR